MRTTKKQAAEIIGRAIRVLTSEADGCWENMTDDYLDVVVALGGLFREYSEGDPRGRKSKVARAQAARLVGGEQELFRA